MAVKLVGLSRFELLTPRLSSVCSNQLSYRPKTLRPFTLTRLEAGPDPKTKPDSGDRNCPARDASRRPL
jgi:hypothetical protein